MSTKDDDLELVLELACLTEHRSGAEQRALLRIARSLDDRRNANVTMNKRMWGVHAGDADAVRQLPPSRWEERVDRSRVLEDGQQPVKLKERKRRPGDP